MNTQLPWEPPAIEPLETGRLMFSVTSRTNPGIKHTVDLEALRGNGFCTCEDFCIRCDTNFKHNGGHIVGYWHEPLEKRRAQPNPARTRCRHCEQVILFWATGILRANAEQHEEAYA